MVALVGVGVSWSPKPDGSGLGGSPCRHSARAHPPAARDGLAGLAIAVFRLGPWWERRAIVRRYPILK